MKKPNRNKINYKKIFYAVFDAIGVVMHRMLFDCLLPKKYRDLSKRDIHTIIFRSDTPAGKRFDIWILVLIAANIILLMVDSMLGSTTLTRGIESKPFSYWLMKVLEWAFTIVFTFEFYLRIYCLKNPRKYVLSFYGIIDILSIFPSYLSRSTGTDGVATAACAAHFPHIPYACVPQRDPLPYQCLAP